ncbi:MAG: hypothetical protein K2Q06_07760 [Parvularculaceae bacterium]|nr:hypothetical protein [Parvularculaceae bacterium]
MELAGLLLLVIAGAAWFAYRFIKRGSEEMARAAEENRKAMEQPAPEIIAANADPRYAAAILLQQIAAMKGDLSNEMDAALLNGMQALFTADEDAAADLFGDAWRALGENNDSGVPVKTLVAPIRARCTPDERIAFLDLMERIAGLESPPTAPQRALIEKVRATLLA